MSYPVAAILPGSASPKSMPEDTPAPECSQPVDIGLTGTMPERRMTGWVGSQFFISRTITLISVQNSRMRSITGALSVACFLAGLWLTLRMLGLLGVILHGIGRWWPILLIAAGLAIIVRSVRLGPHTVVSASLILAGGAAFAITRGFMTGRIWTFAAAAGLMAAGVILAWISVQLRTGQATSQSAVKWIFFRAGAFMPGSSDLERVRVFLLCGSLELDLRRAVSAGARQNVVMIDITAWVGKVNVIVPPDTYVVDHKAFVMRFTKRVQAGFLDEDEMDRADVVASTLAFFGDGHFVFKPVDGRSALAPSAPDTLPGQGGRAPATQ